MPIKGKDNEDWQKHKMMHGWTMLILGVLVLANAYWMFLSWEYFIGIVIVLAGLMKMMKCCHK